jgi:hypothetical protein
MDLVNHPAKSLPVGPGSIDSKRQATAFIRSLDLQSLSFDEIKLHAWHLLDDLVMRTPDAAVGQAVFRARVFR